MHCMSVRGKELIRCRRIHALANIMHSANPSLHIEIIREQLHAERSRTEQEVYFASADNSLRRLWRLFKARRCIYGPRTVPLGPAKPTSFSRSSSQLPVQDEKDRTTTRKLSKRSIYRFMVIRGFSSSTVMANSVRTLRAGLIHAYRTLPCKIRGAKNPIFPVLRIPWSALRVDMRTKTPQYAP